MGLTIGYSPERSPHQRRSNDSSSMGSQKAGKESKNTSSKSATDCICYTVGKADNRVKPYRQEHEPLPH